ncbi:MAG: APC family permease [Aggregatilineales bacterium]
MTETPSQPEWQGLQRVVGLFGAVMMGMGSILGTGVFVSIGIAAGIAGPAVILAIAAAGFVAICNGLNSAQLAANHAVSGGTYEYGYRYLNSWLGFTAGWTFLLAKSASAATAALGFAGYLLYWLGIHDGAPLVPIALAAVAGLTGVVLGGLRRSNVTNIVIVSITIGALAAFVLAGLPQLFESGTANLMPFFHSTGDGPLASTLHACALMFVAYTGYGRIATMGEEVRKPRVIIPRAIILTLVLTMILYVAVAVVGVGAAGVDVLNQTDAAGAAPLVLAAAQFDMPGLMELVAFGAITAMLGVLFNLILGLSRVLLAMGRRGDMPAVTARINDVSSTPYVATLIIGLVIALLVLSGSARTTWSFSAFTVLIYYAITNLAALRLKRDERLFSRWLAWVGLAACLFLAFWVEPAIWLAGLGLIAAGLGWHAVALRLRQR